MSTKGVVPVQVESPHEGDLSDAESARGLVRRHVDDVGFEGCPVDCSAPGIVLGVGSWNSGGAPGVHVDSCVGQRGLAHAEFGLLEIFAGSARLSAVTRRGGARVLAVGYGKTSM